MLKLRAAQAADHDAVAQLFTDSVHALGAARYDGQQRSAWAPQPPNFAGWRQRFAALNILLMDDGDRLAGFIGWADSGHIDLLFTAPGSARRGVASMLYREAEAQLAQAGVAELFTEASLVARPFFDRQGFEVTEAQTVERAGVALNRFAMRKRLAPIARARP